MANRSHITYSNNVTVVNPSSIYSPEVHIHTYGGKTDFNFPVQKFWVEMSYIPPQGGCNDDCHCQRFTLHPDMAATSFECDGCGHHAAYHALENPEEEAIVNKWIDSGRMGLGNARKGKENELLAKPQELEPVAKPTRKRNHMWVPPSAEGSDDQTPAKRAASERLTTGARSSERAVTTPGSDKENESKDDSHTDASVAVGKGGERGNRKAIKGAPKGSRTKRPQKMLYCPTEEAFPLDSMIDKEVRGMIIDHLMDGHGLQKHRAHESIRIAMGGNCDDRHRKENPCLWRIRYLPFSEGERVASRGISFIGDDESWEYVNLKAQDEMSNYPDLRRRQV